MAGQGLGLEKKVGQTKNLRNEVFQVPKQAHRCRCALWMGQWTENGKLVYFQGLVSLMVVQGEAKGAAIPPPLTKNRLRSAKLQCWLAA